LENVLSYIAPLHTGTSVENHETETSAAGPGPGGSRLLHPATFSSPSWRIQRFSWIRWGDLIPLEFSGSGLHSVVPQGGVQIRPLDHHS